MKKNVPKNIVIAAVLIAGLVYAGMSLFLKKDNGIANTEEPTDEQMKQYFEEYSRVTAENDLENMLIVTSDKYPNAYGATDIVEAPNHTYYLMYKSSESCEEAYIRFKQDSSISVDKNIKMKPASYNSWGIEQMGLDDANNAIGYGGNAVKIAIIDTGLNLELFQKYFPDTELTTYDVENDSSNYSDMKDVVGHGTHVAGTIAEGAPKNASIEVIRAVREDNDEFYASDVTTALQKARWDGADVINMSLGSYLPVEAQREQIRYAYEYNKAIVVAAAGNDNTSDVLYPAGYDNTISVSAINSDLSFANYSNYGTTIDFTAPGTNVKSINGIGSGTSISAPHITAAVSILKSYNKNLSLDTTKNLLKDHTQDLGTPGWDEQFGYGMVNFNNVEFCEYDGYCDQYEVFAVEAPVYTKIEIDNVKLTDLNYYSISNLMLTEIKLYTDETNYITKRLQDVHNLNITGYGPETYGLQEVTISCEGLSKKVYVVNPDNYTPGWEYILNNNNQILLTKYYDLRDYDYENNDISVSKLYVPQQINGKDVVELYKSERTVNMDDYSYTTTESVFESSSYANRYITEVYLPESLNVIGEKTFWHFWNLEKVVMESDAVRIGDWAFYGDSALRNVEGTIIELGEMVFSGDLSLEAIELKEGITSIAKDAFSRCYSLKEIEIPSTVITIENGAFSETKSLERVIFNGNSLREIGGSAFAEAKNLKSIIIPDGVETIGGGAFMKTALSSMQIPASVTSIGAGAFSENNNLTTIVVDPSNQAYYDVNDRALMRDYYNSKELIAGTKNMIIPEGTTTIGYGAFAGFTTIGRIRIPDSVKDIHGKAFYGCTGLLEVVIPKIEYMSEKVFEKEPIDPSYNYESTPLDIVLWVYNDNIAHNYAVEKGFNYQTLDASYARITSPFEYGDILSDETEVEFYYDYGTRESGVFTNHTGINGNKTTIEVSQLDEVAYSGEVNHFRISDTYFTAAYKDLLEQNAEIRVNITVNGEYPEYVIPTGLIGKIRTYLSEIELPEGYSWMGEEYIWELGEQTYMAKYTPEDATRYAPVENIPITIEVILGRTKLQEPVITIQNKVYDGEWNISRNFITIEGLDGLVENEDYYVNAYTYNSEVGTTTAVVYINLDYNTAKDYGFGDECDDYYNYYIYDYEILSEEEAPELEVDNRAEGIAEVAVLEDGIAVTAEKACTVIISRDGGETYSKVSAVAMDGEENIYKFTFEITNDIEVMVVLKGDLDMCGTLNARDSAKIDYHLLSSSNPNHRELTALEMLIADLNNSGTITARDASLLDYALLSESNPNHRALAW